MPPFLAKTAFIVPLACLFLPWVALAQQRPPLSHWYVGVKAGAVFTDTQRQASNGALVGLELGQRLSPTSALELELYHNSIDFDAGFNLDQEGAQINYVLTNPVPLWNPYFLVGAGAMHYQAPGESGSDVVFAVATGGQWDLNSKGLKLRAEIRYRYSIAESETPALLKKGEPIFSLGLSFPLSWR